MIWIIRSLLLIYGLALIGGGVMGYVKAQSQASLIAGGVSGVVAILAFFIALKRPRLGFAIGLAVAAAVGYTRLQAYNAAGPPGAGSKDVALYVSLVSLFMVIVLLAGLMAPARPRSG